MFSSTLGRGTCAGLTLLAGSFTASAGNLDVYYEPSPEIKFSDSTGSLKLSEGSGWGIRGAQTLSEVVSLFSEYQSVSAEKVSSGGNSADTDADLSIFRLGFQVNSNSSLSTGSNFFGAIELLRESFQWDDLNIDADENGFGAKIGLESYLNNQFSYWASAGYRDVSDGSGSGPEFQVGVALKVNPNIGLFGDYRASRTDDDGLTVNISGLRFGVRAYL